VQARGFYRRREKRPVNWNEHNIEINIKILEEASNRNGPIYGGKLRVLTARAKNAKKGLRVRERGTHTTVTLNFVSYAAALTVLSALYSKMNLLSTDMPLIQIISELTNRRRQ